MAAQAVAAAVHNLSWNLGRREPPIDLERFGLAPARTVADGIRVGGSPGISEYDPSALLGAFPQEGVKS